MDNKIETVKINNPKAPGEFIIINKSDLKKDDVIYGEKPVKPGRPKKVDK
jgi:hypothetical protein